MDAELLAFLEQRASGPSPVVRLSLIYAEYRQWIRRGPVSISTFGHELRAAGLTPVRRGAGMHYYECELAELQRLQK